MPLDEEEDDGPVLVVDVAMPLDVEVVPVGLPEDVLGPRDVVPLVLLVPPAPPVSS
jgi:hypothetical protein